MTGRPVFVVMCSIVVFALFLPALAQSDQSLLERADACWLQRSDPQKAGEAATLYEKALAEAPSSYDAAWKLARACYWLGENSAEDRKLTVFERGIAAAKKAIALNEGDAAGHFWLGVSYGKYGEAKGILKSLALVDPSKEEMNRVIAIDPAFESGGAYRVLGRIYFKLPGLMGGSNRKAIENLKKAVELGPDRVMNRSFLAEVYIATDEKELARKELETALKTPPMKGYEPETAKEKEQAGKLLESL